MTWLVLTVAAGLANAANILVWKHLAGRGDMLVIAGMNAVLSGLIVLTYTLGVDRPKIMPDAKFIGAVILLAVFSSFITIAFTYALRSGPVTYINPIFGGVLNLSVILFGVLLLGEKLSVMGMCGAAAVVGGILLITMA